jgi:competence protein ComEC
VLFKEIPFLRIVVPLCLGIITGLYLNPGIPVMIAMIFISVSGLSTSLWFNNRPVNLVFGVSCFASIFTGGLLLYSTERESLSRLKQEKTIFIAEISDYPEEKEKSMMLTLKLNTIISDSLEMAVKGSLLLYFRKDTTFEAIKPGDIITFSASPLPVKNKGNPYEFDYKFYLQCRGIKYYAFAGKNDLLSVRSPAVRKISHQALIIRNSIISMYEKRGVSSDRLPLVSAITLGEKSKLDPQEKENFIKAGVMHIMAVSGLHAVILSIFIYSLLFFLKRRLTFLRVLLTILFLWFFAFITGLTPSVLRATLMFTFLQAGKLLKREVNGINSVLASAFILIMIRPSVIFDAGFLLSYSAVIFIIGFYRELFQLLSLRTKPAVLLWQSVAVTLVAQAGTFSLTLYLFNRFPVWFILSNAIIVPLSSIVIILGCLVPLTYPLVPVSELFASALDKLTWLTEFLTARSASLPMSTYDNIGMTIPEYIFLTLSVSFVMVYLLKKPRINIMFPLASILLFILAGTIKDVISGNDNRIIVYNTPGESTVGVKTGRNLILYTDNEIVPREVKRHISTLGLRTDQRLFSGNTVILKAGSVVIVISDSINFRIRDMQEIDFMVITGNKPYISEDILLPSGKNPVIIASEASTVRLTGSLSASNSVRQIWHVARSGAYVHKL